MMDIFMYLNNLLKEKRERIEGLLKQISKDEDIFKRNVRRIQKLIQRLGSVDAQNFRELKERLEKIAGKEKNS